VLGIGVFGLAELCTRRTSARRLALLLVPSLAVMLAFLPMMIASSHAADAKLALDVLVRFEFPIHFSPAKVRYEVWALAGWLAIAAALRPRERGTPLDRLWWFAIVSMGCCLAALLLASIPPLLTLTRLFTWRIAPFGQLAAELMLLLRVIEIARAEAPRPCGWPLALLMLGVTGVLYNAFRRPRDHYPEVIACAMCGCAVAIALRREWIVRALCAGACALALWAGRERLASPLLFATGEAGVTEWARTTSPVDAVFLVAPYETRFRLIARRAIVVDTKSPPMYLDELVAWYRRLCATVDAPALDTPSDAWARWDALPADRLVAIAHAFHADYLVLAKSRTAARVAAPVAYEDPYDVVYAIGP
jgi:hypothetical protein